MTVGIRGDLRGASVLFVPGLRDHVEDHWQSHATRALDAAGVATATVEPLTSDRLSCAARVAALDAALQAIEGDVVLAAHSAGCLMVAHWAQSPTRPIRAALLATPADVERPLPAGYPTVEELTEGGWLPMARTKLHFPALVVASRNDPLGNYDRIADLAQAWGAGLHDAGEVGHLNPPAGFGAWPDALGLIEQLAQRHA